MIFSLKLFVLLESVVYTIVLSSNTIYGLGILKETSTVVHSFKTEKYLKLRLNK